MVTNKSDDRDKGFIYSLPSVFSSEVPLEVLREKAEAASGLSPLSSDLGYCPSGRQCDGSQVVGNLSWRPLKQVAPDGGGNPPAGPRWQSEFQTSRSLYSGSCSALLFTPLLTTSPALHSTPLHPSAPTSGRSTVVPVCCHCVFRRGRSGPSPCTASLIGLIL